MRFRLPEPIHGWPSFWNEIIIVVLGVLIALGATQLVQDYNDRRDLSHVDNVLKAEIYEHVKNMIERLAAEQCQIDRIAELFEKLERSDGRWTADPSVWKPRAGRRAALPEVYRAPLRQWRRDGWDMAVSSGIVRRMDRAEVAMLSAYYTQISRIARVNDEEAAVAARLSPLAFDQHLDRQSILQMQSTLAELDYFNERMTRAARQMPEEYRRAFSGFSARQLKADTADIVQTIREIRGKCAKDVKVPL